MRTESSRPMQSTLFGAAEPARRQSAHSAFPAPAGHAAPPGSGPAGETCSTCDHCRVRTVRSKGRDRRFYKCALMTRAWSDSRATDVLASSPACRMFKPGEPHASTVQNIRHHDGDA